MSDPLDRLTGVARPLLHRADTALAEAGAPPDDPVWPLLRRVGALPSDAVSAVAGWRPAPLDEAAGPLRALARRYAEALDGLPAHPPWEGAGAVAYQVQWAALRGHVTGAGPASLVGRLRETASYLDEVTDWIRRSRLAVAAALADVLDSAEAVTLVTGMTGMAGPDGLGGPQAAGTAAARLTVHVLEPVAVACDEGRQLHDEWHNRLGEVPMRTPRGDPDRVAPDGTVRVGE